MKLIIELSENDYKALKEDGVQNHLALADTVIAHSVPYEERPKGEWQVQPHSMIMRCSLCGYEENAKDVGTINLDKHFCSFCGADMRGKEE